MWGGKSADKAVCAARSGPVGPTTWSLFPLFSSLAALAGACNRFRGLGWGGSWPSGQDPPPSVVGEAEVEQSAAILGLGAALAERAAAAGGSERDRPFRGDRPGNAVRAGHGPSLPVHGVVVDGEPTLNGRAQRSGLDDRDVSGLDEGGAGLA